MRSVNQMVPVQAMTMGLTVMFTMRFISFLSIVSVKRVKIGV